MENMSVTDKICDLLFFQYIIKNNAVQDDEETLDVYEKYKTILNEVIENIKDDDLKHEAKHEKLRKDEALIQLQQLERDVLFVEKSSLIEIGKKTGMNTVAAQIQKLQEKLMKNQVTIPEEDEEDHVISDSDSNDNNVPLEDKVSDDDSLNLSEIEDNDDENVNADSDGDSNGDYTDEEDTEEINPSDKIISIEGTLPQSFTKNNEILPNVSASNGTPIEYFHKTKDWNWLSTFHEADGFFTYKGKRYKTIEHAFNAQKCTNTKYIDMFRMDSSTYIGDSALQAKTTGSTKSFESSGYMKREDWDNVRVSIMKECTRAFFLRHVDLIQKLIDTHPTPLHHTGFKVGTFWGMQKGKGENQHGKILMELRSEFIANRHEDDGESK